MPRDAVPDRMAVARRHSVVAPLAPERYKVQFTVSREAYDELRKVQDLLRHAVPDGDVASIFERALTLLLADLEKKKLGKTARPRRALAPLPRTSRTLRSRHVPADVKREVWERDRGQCAFVGTKGRCTERSFLELHHVIPFADGGLTTVANLQLRCRAHNAYEAEQWSGDLPPLVREDRVPYGLGLDRVWPARASRARTALQQRRAALRDSPAMGTRRRQARRRWPPGRRSAGRDDDAGQRSARRVDGDAGTVAAAERDAAVGYAENALQRPRSHRMASERGERVGSGRRHPVQPEVQLGQRTEE